MMFRTTLASVALSLAGLSAAAQGTPEEAFEIANSQGACGPNATVQSAVYISATQIQVTCQRITAGNGAEGALGGGMGAVTTGLTGLAFVIVFSTIGGGDGGGGGSAGSSTSGT